MRNKVTTDDLMKKYFSSNDVKEINAEIAQEVAKWGGKRKNAGRKTKTGTVLKFCLKVSEKEKEFINYARSHNLNYDELMQG